MALVKEKYSALVTSWSKSSKSDTVTRRMGFSFSKVPPIRKVPLWMDIKPSSSDWGGADGRQGFDGSMTTQPLPDAFRLSARVLSKARTVALSGVSGERSR